MINLMKEFVKRKNTNKKLVKNLRRDKDIRISNIADILSVISNNNYAEFGRTLKSYKKDFPNLYPIGARSTPIIPKRKQNRELLLKRIERKLREELDIIENELTQSLIVEDQLENELIELETGSIEGKKSEDIDIWTPDELKENITNLLTEGNKVVVYVFKEFTLESRKMPQDIRSEIAKIALKENLIENENDSFVINKSWGSFIRKLPENLRKALNKSRKKKYQSVKRLGEPYIFKNTSPDSIFTDFYSTIDTISSGWENYTEEEDDFELKLRFVLIPDDVTPKLELFESDDYNCCLKIIKTNLAHSRNKYNDILDEFNQKMNETSSGCTIDILDEIMPKLELNVILVDILGNRIKTYTTPKTNKVIYMLAHNNHAIKVPKEFLDQNKKMKFKTVDKETLLSLKTSKKSAEYFMIEQNHCLFDRVNNIMYKTYRSMFDYENALSKISDYKIFYKNNSRMIQKDNEIRRKAVPIPVNQSWKEAKNDDIQIDKCNSYRSAYFYMKSLGHKYPTLLQKYSVDKDNQHIAIEIINKYEGFAYVSFTNTPEYPFNIIYNKNNYYVFPFLRYFIDNKIEFEVKYIAFSKLGDDFVPPQLLKKENNLDFNKWNGSLLPNPRLRKITKKKKAKDEFINILQYLVNTDHHIKNIEFGNLLKSEDYIVERKDGDLTLRKTDFDIITKKGYEIEYYEKDINSYQRPLVYSYNLAYQQVQLIDFIKNIPEENLVSIRTDGVRIRRTSGIGRTRIGITDSNSDSIIDFQTKKSLKPIELMDKWQFEYNKTGFHEIFHPIKTDIPEPEIEPETIYLTETALKSPYLTITGMGGTGKTTKAKKMAEKLNGCCFSSSTGLSAMKLGGITIHSLLRYSPEDGEWKFRKNRPILNINHLFLDEAFRLPAKHLDKIFEDLPFTEIILLGDNTQGKVIDDIPIFDSTYWKFFKHIVLDDLDSKRYIHSNGEINYDYLNLVIELRNQTKRTSNRIGNTDSSSDSKSVNVMRMETKKYICKLKKTNPTFNKLFSNITSNTGSIWLTPTKKQAEKKKKKIQVGSEIIYKSVYGKNGERDIINNIATGTKRTGGIEKCYITKKGKTLWESHLDKHYTSASSMTISKSQGLEFGLDENICVLLENIVSISDLYVACSRVRNENCIKLCWK